MWKNVSYLRHSDLTGKSLQMWNISVVVEREMFTGFIMLRKSLWAIMMY